MNLMSTLIWGGPVTAKSVLTAMEGMDSEQQSDARAAIDAQTAVFNVVTDFGAVGDSTTDDAAAIQSALDKGGLVYFPAKTYKIGSALKFESDTILFFEPGATILQGAAINNLMRNKAGSTDGGYTATHNVRIIGATFDGGAYTVDNTLLAFTHAKNISIEHCAFRNGYGAWHDIEINSSRNVTVKSCSFDGSRRSGGNNELVQIDALTSRTVYPFDDEGAVDSAPSKDIIIDSCSFLVVVTGIGHHNSVACENVKITKCTFAGQGSYVMRAGITLPRSTKVTIQDNTFVGLEYGVWMAGYASYSVISNNTISGGTKGIRVKGGGNIVSSNTLSGIASPVEIVQSTLADQNITDGNLVTANMADNCANDFLCENGAVFANLINGVFADKETVVTVSGSTPSITPEDNHIYKCGELDSLTITDPPATGAYTVIFASGSTATVATIPATVIFPGSGSLTVEADTRYEINVMDGYATVQTWPAISS